MGRCLSVMLVVLQVMLVLGLVLLVVAALAVAGCAPAHADGPVVGAAPVLACTDVPCEHVIALAPVAPAAERALLDLHQAAPTAANAINLSDKRFEFGPVAAVMPKVTAAGFAGSYRIAENESGDTAAWADVGGIRWNKRLRAFVGISTNVPIGGRTLTQNARVGGGVLSNGSLFGYTRYKLDF